MDSILEIISAHSGLLVFTVLAAIITVYLLYVMLHPESF
jgi:hypothetical protein